MGYRRMNVHDLKDIYRRLMENQTISSISAVTGFDRKTIRLYRDRMIYHQILSDQKPLTDEALKKILFDLLPSNERHGQVQDGFLAHKDEITDLITRNQDPLKRKTAYQVIKQKYDLPGSYESFKLFVRKYHIDIKCKPPFPRMEYLPGQETQIDYCKCGLMEDPVTGKRRIVHGFIGKLSASRLPYVEFTYAQSQESFVESNIRMLEFFGGVTEYLTIDNLKAGVIKASVYDPQLNQAYAEFAEHYGTFINPCIQAHAKGKAKVERQVPEVRELFRRLNSLHPTFTLKELNQEALKWCREEYGSTAHGTTGVPPMELFESNERATLKPLVPVRFEVPVWKSATVHMDQFISFEKKRFSLPMKYRRSRVHCRRSGQLLQIHDKDYRFIRQYVITSRKVHITQGDFPENLEAMMRGGYPQYLINQAASYGPGVRKLVESVLKPHAFLNARRALGMLDVIKTYRTFSQLQKVCYQAEKRGICIPKQLKILLEDEKLQHVFDFDIPRSTEGETMVRDIEEYFTLTRSKE